MLAAIIFIIIIGLILALTVSLTSNATAKTTNRYLYEQAQLLAKSATEYAVMAVQGHNLTTDCLEHIDMNYMNIFDINISIWYIGNNLPAGCGHILVNDVAYPESNASILIDTKVSLDPSIQAEENSISYVRRTLQKL